MWAPHNCFFYSLVHRLQLMTIKSFHRNPKALLEKLLNLASFYYYIFLLLNHFSAGEPQVWMQRRRTMNGVP